MRIWTITTDNENCTSTGIACTQEEADAAALAFVESYWEAWMDEEPMPSDWQQALSDLQTKAGFMDSIVVEEHDISHHPDLQPVFIGIDLASGPSFSACGNCGNTLNDGSDICDQCGCAFA